MAQLIVITIALALCLTTTLASIPSYMEVCGLRNPNLNTCVKESVLKLMPKLKEGIPEMEIPPLESFNIGRVTVIEQSDFHAIMENVVLHGMSNFKINHLSVNIADQILDVGLIFPKIILDSDSDIKVKILVAVNEKGPLHVVTGDEKPIPLNLSERLTDTSVYSLAGQSMQPRKNLKIAVFKNGEAKVSIKYKIVNRHGQRYMFWTSMTTKITLKTFEIIYKPDAENNPLTEAINSVLTSSKHDLAESIIPDLERSVSKKMLEICNIIASHFTYDELFPDRA